MSEMFRWGTRAARDWDFCGSADRRSAVMQLFTGIEGATAATVDSELARRLRAVVGTCLRRIRSWRTPARWSTQDWRVEADQVATIAAWQASGDSGQSQGTGLENEISKWIMACVRRRHREEWRYAAHTAPEIEEPPEEGAQPPWRGQAPTTDEFDSSQPYEPLREALESLSLRQQFLVHALFWDGRTEEELGRHWGISQRGVSKRKAVALALLRERLCEGNGRLQTKIRKSEGPGSKESLENVVTLVEGQIGPAPGRS